jgi:exopolysaccharide production protein ExoQ
MPPHLVLGICFVFIAFLLWIDGKKSKGISWTVWIPTIWMLYCASRPIAAWLNSGNLADADVAEGSPMDRNFLLLLLGMCIFVLGKRGISWSQLFRENTWLFFFFGYMLLSVVWSDYSFVSLKRWIRASGSILMAGVMLTEKNPRQALEAALRRTAYILIPLSAVMVKWFSEQGQDYNQWTGETMWVGVTTQKNCLGRLCLIAGFFLFWEFFKRWRHKDVERVKYENIADAAVMGLTFWLLLGSHSATSLAVLMFISGIYLVIWRFRDYLKRAAGSIEAAIVAAVVVIGGAYFIFGDALLGAIVGSLGRDLTFTGRTDIWALLIPIAKKHIIVGLGYGSFWINSPLPWPGLNEGHNGYLDVTLELGLVGLVILLAFLGSFYRKARLALTKDFDMAAFNICFLLLAVIHNCTETSFARSTTHLWVVLVVIALVSPRIYRIAARQTKAAQEQKKAAPTPSPEAPIAGLDIPTPSPQGARPQASN